jgi:molybdate transport system regulatory protein
MESKELRVRCWVELDGKKFFGPGPARLLDLIDREGSIAKAAKQMGMSYKKAWDIVTDLNTRGKEHYVVSRKGGEKGGGAELTEAGRLVLTHYRSLTQKLNSLVSKESELLTYL